MAESDLMKHWSNGYVRRTALIGALYSILPTCLYFAVMCLTIPFRDVYALRFALSLLIGGAMAAFVHRRGVSFWLSRHHSPDGPVTIMDGALIGAGVGLSGTLVPALTSLIGTNHLELAKWFIIGAWLAALLLGGGIGAVLTAIGRVHIPRNAPAAGG
jgi:hypothetical protein